jgi:hypothetical protein
VRVGEHGRGRSEWMRAHLARARRRARAARPLYRPKRQVPRFTRSQGGRNLGSSTGYCRSCSHSDQVTPRWAGVTFGVRPEQSLTPARLTQSAETMECDCSSPFVNAFTRTINFTDCREWKALAWFFLEVLVALYSCHPLIYRFDAHNHTIWCPRCLIIVGYGLD